MKIITKVYSGADIVVFYWDEKSRLIYGQGYFADRDVWGPISAQSLDEKFQTARVAQKYMRWRLQDIKSSEKEFQKL